MRSDWKFKLLVLTGAASLILAVLTSTRPGEADTKAGLEIDFEGQLLDEDQRPIAGIYPLEFLLYRGTDDERAIWRETHWVAVASGRYKVRLGTESLIRPELARDGRKVFLGVNLTGAGELTRQSITLPDGDKKPDAAEVKVDDKIEDKIEDKKAIDKKNEAAAAARKGAEPPARNDGKTQYKTESSFAEVADFARRAGVAEDAEKVGGKSLKELEDEIERLRGLLAEHRTDPAAHASTKGKTLLGTDNTVLPRVGGTGGSAYLRECPPGYVVTGIRGSSGALIDSVQLICSPLQ